VIVHDARPRAESVQDAIPPTFDASALIKAFGPHLVRVRGARLIALRRGYPEELHDDEVYVERLKQSVKPNSEPGPRNMDLWSSKMSKEKWQDLMSKRDLLSYYGTTPKHLNALLKQFRAEPIYTSEGGHIRYWERASLPSKAAACSYLDKLRAAAFISGLRRRAFRRTGATPEYLH